LVLSISLLKLHGDHSRTLTKYLQEMYQKIVLLP